MAKKYIDADKMKAEIKRQKHELELSIQSQGDYGQSCHIVAYDNILSLIDSLQQEQPEQDITEFEKALNDFGDAYATLVDRDNNPNIGIHCNAYHELVQERVNEILSLAKEYVKREQRDVDLEEGLADYCRRYYNYDYPKQAEEGTGSSVMPHIIEAAKYFYELGRLKTMEEDK